MEQEPDTPWHLHFISREARRACGQRRASGWAAGAPSLACPGARPHPSACQCSQGVTTCSGPQVTGLFALKLGGVVDP